jgi:hypothetical protein
MLGALPPSTQEVAYVDIGRLPARRNIRYVFDKYATGNAVMREKPSIPVGAAIKLSCFD